MVFIIIFNKKLYLNKFLRKYFKDHKNKAKFKRKLRFFHKNKKIKRFIIFDKTGIINNSLKSNFFFFNKFFVSSNNLIFYKSVFKSYYKFFNKKYNIFKKILEKKKTNKKFFIIKKYKKKKFFFNTTYRRKNFLYKKYRLFFKKKRNFYYFCKFVKRKKPFFFKRSKRKFVFFSKSHFSHSYKDLYFYKTFFFIFKNLKKFYKFLKNIFFIFFLIKKKKNFFINFLDIFSNRSVLNKLSSGFFFKRSLRKTFYAYNHLLKQIKIPLRTLKRKKPKFIINFSGTFFYGGLKKMVKNFLKDNNKLLKIEKYNNIFFKPHNGIRKKKRRRK